MLFLWSRRRMVAKRRDSSGPWQRPMSMSKLLLLERCSRDILTLQSRSIIMAITHVNTTIKTLSAKKPVSLDHCLYFYGWYENMKITETILSVWICHVLSQVNLFEVNIFNLFRVSLIDLTRNRTVICKDLKKYL